jgi:hypothetical protein
VTDLTAALDEEGATDAAANAPAPEVNHELVEQNLRLLARLGLLEAERA